MVDMHSRLGSDCGSHSVAIREWNKHDNLKRVLAAGLARGTYTGPRNKYSPLREVETRSVCAVLTRIVGIDPGRKAQDRTGISMNRENSVLAHGE